MICGDPERFAIEFQLWGISEAPWVYGSFFFWAGGRRYGNPEDAVALNAASGVARGLLDRSFDYRSQELYDLPTKELFRLVGTPDEDAPLEYSRYNVDEMAISSFDKDKDTFILVKSNDDEERLLWSSEKDHEIGEVRLRPGEFAHVVSIFLEQYEREKELFAQREQDHE